VRRDRFIAEDITAAGQLMSSGHMSGHFRLHLGDVIGSVPYAKVIFDLSLNDSLHVRRDRFIAEDITAAGQLMSFGHVSGHFRLRLRDVIGSVPKAKVKTKSESLTRL